MNEDSTHVDLGFQTGRDGILVCFAKDKNLVSMINKHYFFGSPKFTDNFGEL